MEFLLLPFLGKALWLWVVFLVAVAVILALDLGVFNRKDHIIGFRESLKMSAVYIVLGLLFGLWVWQRNGFDAGMDYYTVYVLEKTLSLDNLFVMSVIFASFAVPREYQHRLLVWGIIGVIILRGVTIAAGTALVQQYDWILFVFAAILFYTGVKLLMVSGDAGEREDYTQKPYVRFMARYLRVDDQIHGRKFFIKTPVMHGGGKAVWHATPLFLALCTIELTDLLFAFDSVPAALAITTDTYVVFTANVFAILGLRALFFAMESVLHRFIYLKYSLSVLLMFIAGKVFYTQLFDQHVPAALSLGLTVAILGAGIAASLIRTKRGETHPH